MQREVAAEGLDAVGQADESGAAGEVGAAAAVIADADVQHAAVGLQLDVDDGGRGVLRRVGQRLGDDVVGGELAPGYFTPSAPFVPSVPSTRDGETKSSNGLLSDAQMAQITDVIKTLITKGAK